MDKGERKARQEEKAREEEKQTASYGIVPHWLIKKKAKVGLSSDITEQVDIERDWQKYLASWAGRWL